MSRPAEPRPFVRAEQIERLTAGEPFDLVVIGGGATGVGVAVDAASRGYRVALCEQDDFGKGTSSRSTKLVHGGVRYLEQGDVRLVRDALRERGRLLRNAPHLVYKLPTIVPLYRLWERPYYRAGLAAYDLLAGRLGFGRSRGLSRAHALAELPTLRAAGLRGGVRYYDGAFDDARLLLALARTAVDHGAVCVNHLRVEGLLTEGGRIIGVTAVDAETGASHNVRAKAVVNAGGPFGDAVRRLADPQARPWLQPSQGIHLVFDRRFLPGDSAMLVPRTQDGRVVFAIPWHGKTLVGTTDTPLDAAPLEPTPREDEIKFLLETAGEYLDPAPTLDDILAIFAGIRPLVRKDAGQETSRLGRDHAIRVDGDTGLVTVLGGKWTTYRKMAEDCVDRCAEVFALPRKPCFTADLAIHGADTTNEVDRLACYGSEANDLRRVIAADAAHREKLDAALPYTVGEAVWAIREEMARTVEDVLSRRLRMLLLDARAAIRAAPRVAELIAAETGRDPSWVEREARRFEELAANYVPRSGVTSLPDSE